MRVTDGKTALVAGYGSADRGGAVILTYDAASNSWPETGKLWKAPGANGRYGQCCSISADGRTALVAGWSTSSAEVFGLQYNESRRMGRIRFIRNILDAPHDLPRPTQTENTVNLFDIGDGTTVLVAGNCVTGCAYKAVQRTTNEWGNYESDGAFSARTGDISPPTCPKQALQTEITVVLADFGGRLDRPCGGIF